MTGATFQCQVEELSHDQNHFLGRYPCGKISSRLFSLWYEDVNDGRLFATATVYSQAEWYGQAKSHATVSCWSGSRTSKKTENIKNCMFIVILSCGLGQVKLWRRGVCHPSTVELGHWQCNLYTPIHPLRFRRAILWYGISISFHISSYTSIEYHVPILHNFRIANNVCSNTQHSFRISIKECVLHKLPSYGRMSMVSVSHLRALCLLRASPSMRENVKKMDMSSS